MFIGEYVHTIDTKKRLAIPAKFRKEFGQRGILTRGLDTCLFLYPAKTWEGLADKLGSLPVGQSGTRSFIRLLLSGAADAELDSLGRILVPDYLKKYGDFKKRIVIAGVGNRIELWDEAGWNTYKSRAEQSTDEVAEKLGELGIY